MKSSIGAVIVSCLAFAVTGNCFAQSDLPVAKATSETRVDTSIPETTQQYDEDAWKEGERITHLGFKALADKKPVAALDYFRKALPLHICFTEDYLGMAKAFEQLGKWRPAIKAYRMALFDRQSTLNLAGGTEGTDNLLSYAAVCLKASEQALAYDALIKATAEINTHVKHSIPLQIPDLQLLTPSDIKAYITLGFAADKIYNFHDDKSALPYLEQVISLKPHWSLAQFYKGVALSSLRRNTEAKAAYQKAVELDKDDGTIKATALAAIQEIR